MEGKNEFKVNGKPINLIIGLVVLAVFIIGLLNLARFLYYIFSFLAPVLLIATAIIDHKVILNYGKWIVQLVNKNPLMGIAAGLLSLFFYPVVAAFLFSKAMFKKQLKQAENKEKEEFINFEEMDSKPLKVPEVRKEGAGSSEYEDLID